MSKNNQIQGRILDDCQVRIAGNVEETRTITFVASNESRDSHGTVLPVSGWDLGRFNRNGVVGYMHNVYGNGFCFAPNPDDVIGRGHAWIEEGALCVSITFEPREINEMADKIFQKIKWGSLRAVSVGFAPIGKGHYGEGDEAKGESRETFYFEGMELLEISVVNIPSNPDALRRQLRSSAVQALGFIYNVLDGQIRLSDIENMKVGDILRLIDRRSAVENIDPENMSGDPEEDNSSSGSVPAEEISGSTLAEDPAEKERELLTKARAILA